MFFFKNGHFKNKKIIVDWSEFLPQNHISQIHLGVIHSDLQNASNDSLKRFDSKQ